MAKISIQHEDFSDHIGKIHNYEEYYKTHTENIKRFKAIVAEVLKDTEGTFIFNYITKYYQFDPITGPIDLTADQIQQIDKQYPGCFI